VSLVRYELGFYIAEDGILHSHRSESLKSYKVYYLLQNKKQICWKLEVRFGSRKTRQRGPQRTSHTFYIVVVTYACQFKSLTVHGAL
jgi:hypothetical protein